MDSASIAPALEKLQPERPLHFDDPAVARVQGAIGKIWSGNRGLRTICLPRVPRLILNPRSAEYFERTRAEQFGMTLAEVEKSENAKGAWEAAGAGLQELKALVKENGGGPFVLGEKVSYADFVLVSFFVFLRRLGEDLFERVMEVEEGFGELFKACEKWIERDDH